MDNGETYSSNFDASPEGPAGTISFVEENLASVGYVGYSYYFQNGIDLFVAAIQNEAGDFVTPGADSVVDGTYNPLSRTIYMNVWNDTDALARVIPFLKFGFSSDGTDIVLTTGYVPIAEPASQLAKLIDPSATEAPQEGEMSAGSPFSGAVLAVTTVLVLSSALNQIYY